MRERARNSGRRWKEYPLRVIEDFAKVGHPFGIGRLARIGEVNALCHTVLVDVANVGDFHVGTA